MNVCCSRPPWIISKKKQKTIKLFSLPQLICSCGALCKIIKYFLVFRPKCINSQNICIGRGSRKPGSSFSPGRKLKIFQPPHHCLRFQKTRLVYKTDKTLWSTIIIGIQLKIVFIQLSLFRFQAYRFSTITFFFLIISNVFFLYIVFQTVIYLYKYLAIFFGFFYFFYYYYWKNAEFVFETKL